MVYYIGLFLQSKNKFHMLNADVNLHFCYAINKIQVTKVGLNRRQIMHRFYCRKILLLLAVTCITRTAIDAADDVFQISNESFDKIHSKEFVSLKKTFAESPSLFQNKKDFEIPTTIAFEDSREKNTSHSRRCASKFQKI